MRCGSRLLLEAQPGPIGTTSESQLIVKRHGKSLLCVLATVIAGVSVGCSGPQPTPDPYSEDFRQAKELATSDLERAVLEDGKVTRSEYEEAMQRYVACIGDGGSSVTLKEQGGYYVYQVSGDIEHYDQISEGCARGTTVLIEPLYVDVLTNPDRLDPDEALARCYVAAGLVAAPFGAQDLRDLMTAAGADGSVGTPIDPAAVELVNSEKSMTCMENPSSGGKDR